MIMTIGYRWVVCRKYILIAFYQSRCILEHTFVLVRLVVVLIKIPR